MKHTSLMILLAAVAAIGFSAESYAGDCRTVCKGGSCYSDCPSEAPQVRRPQNPRATQPSYSNQSYQPHYRPYNNYYYQQYQPRCGWVWSYYYQNYVRVCR